MGSRPTKAADNVYCRARYESAQFDERLKSREGAAELLGLSPSTLADYELGTTKCVPVDSVVRMADLYNAPELLNHYCVRDCPIGRDLPVEVSQLESIALRVLSAFNGSESVRDSLVSITADGQITEDEQEQFKQVLQALDDLSAQAQELKLWAKKRFIGGEI
jgi:hypothetical protein